MSMGNQVTCMKKKKKDRGDRGSRRKRSHRKLLVVEEELSSVLPGNRFDVSMGRSTGSTSSRRITNSTRCYSFETQLPDLSAGIRSMRMKIVLIHGEGFGAWCWYKITASLETSGFIPIALDLSGSGIEFTDVNDITTLSHYSKPLTDYLGTLEEDESVVLVGHSGGGACVSHAMEHHPEKISKAVFLSAAMVSDGQRPFDLFGEEVEKNNDPSRPASSGFMFEKRAMKMLYFNHCSAKDVALSMACLRPFPMAPMMERLELSCGGYGRGRRFFIQTLDDHAISADVQEKMVRENPPERVFKIKGADHCPFFSKPLSLHKILLEIALTH